MNFSKIKGITLVFTCILILLSSISVGATVGIREQVVGLVNLGPGIEIESYQNGQDTVVLWREPWENNKGYAKNWGLVLFNQDQPVDIWFYSGPQTNSFQNFYPSFQQFTGDGRKELAVVGVDPIRNGWAQFFIFNLTDRGISLLHQGETNSRGGNYFVPPAEIFQRGMFTDLDKDGKVELLVYREVRGSLPAVPIWVDIYSWNGQRFELVNAKYPEFFTPFYEAFLKAASEEEKMTNGNYRIYYEHMAKILDIWGETRQAADAREKAILPPLEMGAKVFNTFKGYGLETHQVWRVDLDGTFPLDAIIWSKDKADGRDQLWVIGQNHNRLGELIPISLNPAFFAGGGEIEVRAQNRMVEISRKFTKETPGLIYLFGYNGRDLNLVGIEERVLLDNGRIIRRVAGDSLSTPDLDNNVEYIVTMPLIQAVQSIGSIWIDGVFNDQVWSILRPEPVKNRTAIIFGGGEWQGEHDLSFTVQAAYTDSSLYLGVKVKDDRRFYSQSAGLDQCMGTDHLQIWFEERGQIHHYGLFMLADGVQSVEYVGERAMVPTYPVRAQWLPSSEGYWVEIEIQGLNLNREIYPLTIVVADTDSKDKKSPESLMATYPYRTQDKTSLGMIILR